MGKRKKVLFALAIAVAVVLGVAGFAVARSRLQKIKAAVELERRSRTGRWSFLLPLRSTLAAYKYRYGEFPSNLEEMCQRMLGADDPGGVARYVYRPENWNEPNQPVITEEPGSWDVHGRWDVLGPMKWLLPDRQRLEPVQFGLYPDGEVHTVKGDDLPYPIYPEIEGRPVAEDKRISPVHRGTEAGRQFELGIRIIATYFEDYKIIKQAWEQEQDTVRRKAEPVAKWVPYEGPEFPPPFGNYLLWETVLLRLGGVTRSVPHGYLLVLLSELDIENSVDSRYLTPGPDGNAMWRIIFSEEGAHRLRTLTEQNVGRRAALIVNGRVRAIPKIRAPVDSILVPALENEIPAGWEKPAR